jgi:hypothetical protein
MLCALHMYVILGKSYCTAPQVRAHSSRRKAARGDARHSGCVCGGVGLVLPLYQCSPSSKPLENLSRQVSRKQKLVATHHRCGLSGHVQFRGVAQPHGRESPCVRSGSHYQGLGGCVGACGTSPRHPVMVLSVYDILFPVA